MKTLLRKLVFSPLGSPLRNWYRGAGTILLYHRITSEALNPDAYNPGVGLRVHVGQFEAQIKHFSEEFECISLQELVHILQGTRPAPRRHYIAVTFDDGFADNLHLALPILEKYGVPATIFVTTGFIDRTHEPWWMQTGASIRYAERIEFTWQGLKFSLDCSSVGEQFKSLFILDELMKGSTLAEQSQIMSLVAESTGKSYSFGDQFLTAQEVVRLEEHPLITIGAHTVSHAPLAACRVEDLSLELVESRRRLTEILGHAPAFNAYPYGSKSECGEREFEASSAAGYLAAFTARPGHVFPEHGSALHSIPRIAIDHFMTLDVVKEYVLSGVSAMVKNRGQRIILD